MEIKFNLDQFQQAKSGDLLPLICHYCRSIFYRSKCDIRRIKANDSHGKYCSLKCKHSARSTGQMVECLNCGISFYKEKMRCIKSPNHFCSQSCAACFNNNKKSTGTRRSKLEIWIEQELRNKYPTLEITCNDKNIINSELDIYFPSLKLAIELNGIFHYEPIYGVDKLSQIQNNDTRKFQACIEHGIELCIIDTSSLQYFKPQKAKLYFEIVDTILASKLFH